MKKAGAQRLLQILLIIAIVVTAIWLLASVYLDRFAKEQLQNAFNEESAGKYTLTISKLRLGLFTGSLTVTDFSIKPGRNAENEIIINTHAKQLSFHGIHILRYFFGKGALVDEIRLTEPTVIIYGRKDLQTENFNDTTDFSLYGFIRKFARSVTIKRLAVNNFDFEYFHEINDSVPSLKSKENDFLAVNLRVGPETEKLPGMFSADSVSFSVSNFAYTTADSLYTFNVGKMNVIYSDSALVIDSVKVVPNYSKRRFAEIAGKQTDRFDISARKLYFHSVDLKTFIEYHGFDCKKLEIQRFNLRAFRDKNDTRHFAVPMSVQQLLRESPVFVNIDTIELKQSNIIYEEVAPGKKAPGVISFDNIEASLTGITNDSVRIQENSKIVVEAVSKLSGEGTVKALFIIPMKATGMEFFCGGLITGVPLKTLNKMVEPTAGISFSSGFIDSIDFEFNAGDVESRGWMKFRYKDLQIELPESGKNNTFGEKLMVFLANNLIIKKNNPSGEGYASKVPLHYERNRQRFMFNYTWKTLYSGIKETVGVPEIKP
jgi:hypothetical protein